MKTTVTKSDVFKRAWSIFKNNSDMFCTFSAALTRAWEVEKGNAERRAKQESEKALFIEYKPVADYDAHLVSIYKKNVILHGVDYAAKAVEGWS